MYLFCSCSTHFSHGKLFFFFFWIYEAYSETIQDLNILEIIHFRMHIMWTGEYIKSSHMFTSSLYGWRFIFGSEFLLVCYACYTHIHIFNNFMVYHNGMLGVCVFVIIQPAQPSKTTNQLECEVAQWQNVWFLSPFFPWFIHNIGIHTV